MKPEVQLKYYRNEYEQLRRRKNKEIEDLKTRMANGSRNLFKFLSETEQLERYYEWLKEECLQKRL